VLSDPERRRRYDMVGDERGAGAGRGPGPADGGLGDLFDAFFGGSDLFGGFLVMLAVIALGYGIISTPEAAEKEAERVLVHEDAEGNPIIHA
jgi:DnaJ-class molecular chaperone